MRRYLVGLLLVFFLVACSSSGPAPGDSPSVTPGEPHITWTGTHPFLPDQDYIFGWSRISRTGQEPLTEQWVREDGRIIVAQDGRPVYQWAIGSTGVWAPDPQNPNLMLRFLPVEPLDGLVWYQESDGQTVWFRLRQTASGGNDRWLLTMLNRGARYDYEFDPRNSLLHWGDGSTLTMGGGSPKTINPAERAAILAAAPPLPTHLAPVVAADQAAFAAALIALPGEQLIEADIDGDGRMEQIVGAFGSWTSIPIDLLDASGAHRRSIVRGVMHPEVMMIGQQPRFLIDEGGSLHIRWFDRTGEQVATRMGPDPFQTPASSYRQLGAGLLEVTWEPGDAAGHRRIRTLRLHPGGEVTLADERWEAVEGTLRPAATAYAALEGLFFTRWYNRPDDEAVRYLANPADLALLKALSPIGIGLGPKVRFVQPQRAGGDCIVETAPEPPLEPWGEWHGFAVWESYPGGATDITLGRASFTRASEGRALIGRLEIQQTCHYTH